MLCPRVGQIQQSRNLNPGRESSPVSPDMKGRMLVSGSPVVPFHGDSSSGVQDKDPNIMQQPASAPIGKTAFQACSFYTDAHTTRKIEPEFRS